MIKYSDLKRMWLEHHTDFKSYLHMYLSGLREEEEGKKNLNIKIVIQINHSMKIVVLRDVKVCSLENKYLCEA